MSIFLCAAVCAYLLKGKGHGSLLGAFATVCVFMCASTPLPSVHLSVLSGGSVEKEKCKVKEGKRSRKENWLPGQTWQASDCIPSQSASTCCWSATRRERESVRKRYADRWIERHKERELWNWIFCWEVHRDTPVSQPTLAYACHTHTNSCWPLPPGSVSLWRRPVAPWHRASPNAHLCQQVVTGIVHSGYYSPLIPCQQFIT